VRTLEPERAAGHHQLVMEADHARSIAERHLARRDEDGVPLILHVRRVVARTPVEAHTVAWLHEVLERTTVSEHELLLDGLTDDQLRALRLLHRNGDSRSDHIYLAHVERIVSASGHSGDLARTVKIADLEDRLLHPWVRGDGWSPPYEQALQLLLQPTGDRHAAGAFF
jgi:hypothetical protein